MSLPPRKLRPVIVVSSALALCAFSLPVDKLQADPPAAVEAAATLILARHCLECHNPSDRKGNLDLTRRETALAGGDTGPAFSPDDPAASLLLQRIAAGEMPPKDRPKLTPDERQQLETWLSQGARWSVDPIDPLRYTTDRRAGYDWWSLQPVRSIEPPAVKNETWVVNPIDRFVLAGLEAAGLPPSPQAERGTLIRRLSFDLTGLPPTPEELAEFVADNRPEAYERLVDRLLDSPHYGERWARHWLDIVRYGESQGFERNKFRPNAWKYRDFVVEAFNSDLPYDEFIRWQLAGDVLRPDDPLAVIGSGFLALGPYDLTAYNNGTPDMRAFAREEELEGLVAVVCQTFLGLTVNCARCHDHKFDPVTQKEFYQISAALGGIYQGPERESLREEARPATNARREELKTQIAAIVEKEAKASEEEKRSLALQRSRLESVERLLSGGPVHTTVPRQPGAWRVLARGDFRQPGEAVAPGGIAAVSGIAPDWQLAHESPEADRRKALADWITNPANPLTTRVIVNRLWLHHFGEGLVRTPNDFGFQGGQPSHPELLDWLARESTHPAEGHAWSLKRIQKLIVMSATYRQASRVNKEAMAVDADNRLLWRRPPQRLEAEAIRDAVLAVSGELDPRLGGPGYRDYTVTSAGDNESYHLFDAIGPEFNRRSIYRTWLRTGSSPLLDVLDCPDPSVPTPRRSVTSTPLQALSLLNNKFMEHHAEQFAKRLQREAAEDVAGQTRRAYLLAFSREPESGELEFAKAFIDQYGLAQFCLVLLNANEFVYVD